MATIRKRGDYQWQAIVKRRGYPVQRKTFTYRKDAEAWARDVETRMERGSWMDTAEGDRTTIAEALDRYAREIAPREKDGGVRTVRRMKNILAHPIAQTALSRVGTADVARYRDDRLKAVKPNTVRLELAILSHLFTIAQQEWGMPYLSNPVKVIKKPSVVRDARDRRLKGDEEERLLAACREYGGAIEDVVVFAIETAMRRGEIASLRWGDVSLARRVAHLPETKNGTSRDVPLSRRAIEVLKRRGQVRKLNDDRVFGIEPNGISQAFSRVCKRAGIEDLRFHDLRHEATSRLFERGLDLMQVAAITGHKTLQMLKRYTHLKAEDLARMLD